MTELVVISGKGGTGKTSVLASLAALATKAVLADCDVDAADLHLVLAPEVRRREEFRSGREAVIRQADCLRCGACLAHCRFEAVRMDGKAAGEATFHIDPSACEGCGVCVRFCPAKAIDFPERVSGEWYVSETRFGPMVHARLGIAAENSGKLVSTVRREARRLAHERRLDWILVDGPPGLGCPVIASVAGADLVLVVAEPTLAGRHDLQRVQALTRHFGVRTIVCINKADLNPELSGAIEAEADRLGTPVVAKVRYDPAVTWAQLHQRSVVEYTGAGVTQDLQDLWRRLVVMGG